MNNNRQFKFRVWNTRIKQFYKSCLIGLDGEVFTSYVEKMNNGTFIHRLRLLKKEENIIQQYAGFDDKNKKEIYEGDIVKYKYWNGSSSYENDNYIEYKSEIRFENGSFFPRYIDSECEDPWYSYKYYDLEIVGNIFETPELLPTKQ